MVWHWENSGKKVTLPVGFCRDNKIFDTDKAVANLDKLRDDKDNNEIKWQLTGDNRCFILPVDYINYFPKNNNLFRDTIACLTQMYLDSGSPDSKIIITSLRQIADNMGIAINGSRAEEIDNILSFARWYAIKGQRLHRIENGKTIEYETEFSFLQSINRVVSIDGKLVSPRTAKREIMLSDKYAEIVGNMTLPKAPVPVAALQIANKAPRKLITPMKNFIYNLSALIPRKNPEYSLEMLRKITGYETKRKDRLCKSLENLFDYLTPEIIEYEYNTEREKYIFKCVGEVVSGKKREDKV